MHWSWITTRSSKRVIYCTLLPGCIYLNGTLIFIDWLIDWSIDWLAVLFIGVDLGLPGPPIIAFIIYYDPFPQFLFPPIFVTSLYQSCYCFCSFTQHLGLCRSMLYCIVFIHFYSASYSRSFPEALPTTAIDTVSEFTRRSTTVSEGLAQGPYVAARAGFEPSGRKASNLPMRHHTPQYNQL